MGSWAAGRRELTQKWGKASTPWARTWARVGGWTWLLLQASTTAFYLLYVPAFSRFCLQESIYVIFKKLKDHSCDQIKLEHASDLLDGLKRNYTQTAECSSQSLMSVQAGLRHAHFQQASDGDAAGSWETA